MPDLGDLRSRIDRIDRELVLLRPGEHLFFLELSGHRSEPPLREALDDLRPATLLHRVLGSFPAADQAL